MPSLVKLIIIVVVFIILWALTVIFSRERIEADLTFRSKQILEQTDPRYKDIQVSFIGRDAVLFGELPSDLSPDAITELVESVWGVRQVNASNLTKKALPNPEPPRIEPKEVTESPTLPELGAAKLESYSIYFAFNKFLLTSDSKSTLKDLAAELKSHSEVDLEIAGHTDELGSVPYNDNLGLLRANAVKDFLVENGIRSETLHTVSFGEEELADDGGTSASRKLNRRVEFSLK
ncbi:MAG: OmpA family protein [Verrucomicrobiota bacterium]